MKLVLTSTGRVALQIYHDRKGSQISDNKPGEFNTTLDETVRMVSEGLPTINLHSSPMKMIELITACNLTVQRCIYLLIFKERLLFKLPENIIRHL